MCWVPVRFGWSCCAPAVPIAKCWKPCWRGIIVQRQLEFGTLEAIFGCVSAGLGITMLPRTLVGGVWDATRVAVHPLPPEDAVVETVFIRRRNGFVPSALRAFLACVSGG
jgi:DNA-binding transcriptional LysR family regulator